jgi:tetratricopeptide (TPR) repeat protein
MSNPINVGDQIEVTLVAREEGVATSEAINGSQAWVRAVGAEALIGDRWLVKACGNKAGSEVRWVEPVRLISAHDGLDEMLNGLSPYHVREVRKACARLRACLAVFTTHSLEHGQYMSQVAQNTRLPGNYRNALAHQALEVLKKHCGDQSEELIPVFMVLAFTATAEQQEAGFRRLLAALEMHDQQQEPLFVNTLANLGRICHEQGRFEEAHAFYERARKISTDEYLAFQLAVTLQKLGRSEEACELLLPLADGYFGVMDSEFSKQRNQVETEGYTGTGRRN